MSRTPEAIAREFKATIADIFSAAISFKSTHSAILGNLEQRVYSTKAYNRLPNYERGRLYGTVECQFDTIERYHLEWRMFHTPTLSYKPLSFAEWKYFDTSFEGKFYWKDSERIYF